MSNQLPPTVGGVMLNPLPPTTPVSPPTLLQEPRIDPEMLSIVSKLHGIEEKSHCGGVMLLDKIADFLERCSVRFHNWSIAVRSKTAKINAPCAVSFGKSSDSSLSIKRQTGLQRIKRP